MIDTSFFFKFLFSYNNNIITRGTGESPPLIDIPLIVPVPPQIYFIELILETTYVFIADISYFGTTVNKNFPKC